MKTAVTGLFLLLLLSTCAATTVFAQKTATVVGRFIIRHPVKGQYKKHKRLYFTEQFDRKNTRLVKKKHDGYFRLRLPLGYSYLEKVHYFDGGEFMKKFPPGYLELKLDSADRVYYIGDIVLTWDILATEQRPDLGIAGGLVGGLLGHAIVRTIERNQEGRISGEALPVTVSHVPETLSHFRDKLGIKDGELSTSLLKVRQAGRK